MFGDVFETVQPSNSYRVLVATTYAVLAVLGLLANVLFCTVVYRCKKLHTVTHMLMSNLAASNVLFLLFHPAYFITTFILESSWVFGTVLCKMSFSISYVTATGSFYLMCLVAVDRWLAIFARKRRLDRKKCIFLTLLVWSISLVVATPYMHLSTTTIFVQYVIPLLIMIPAYSHLAIFLWRRPTIGVQSREKVKKQNRRRRRLLATLLAIVGFLIACWVPLFAVNILISLNLVSQETSLSLYVYSSMVTLLGVLATPICYVMNDIFREQTMVLLSLLVPGWTYQRAASKCASGNSNNNGHQALLGENTMNRTEESHLSPKTGPRKHETALQVTSDCPKRSANAHGPLGTPC